MLLVEVLIAIFLIGLMIAPLLTPLVRIYRQEAVFTAELEAQRMADQFFALQVEKLYRNEIPFNRLIKSEWRSIDKPDFKSQSYKAEARYKILTNAAARTDRQPPPTPYDLVWVHLRLTPQNKKYGKTLKYDRKFLVERTTS